MVFITFFEGMLQRSSLDDGAVEAMRFDGVEHFEGARAVFEDQIEDVFHKFNLLRGSYRRISARE